jgi:quercetin dioxygenase-like cupin family protein
MRKWEVLGVLLLALPSSFAAAQSPSPSSGPIRTVLALGRLSGPLQDPMQINLSRVVIPAGAIVRTAGVPAMIYVTAGTVVASAGADRKTVRENEGFHVPANVESTLAAHADGKAEILVYRLMPGTKNDPALGSPASSTEIHRMKLSSSLQSGPFEFSMTRVTLPAGATRPRPHTRSGAALYYVLSEGSITIWPEATLETLKGDSRTEARPTGAVQEEPYGFIHSWSPAPQKTLILLQANISQEGSPEIIFVK